MRIFRVCVRINFNKNESRNRRSSTIFSFLLYKISRDANTFSELLKTNRLRRTRKHLKTSRFTVNGEYNIILKFKFSVVNETTKNWYKYAVLL